MTSIFVDHNTHSLFRTVFFRYFRHVNTVTEYFLYYEYFPSVYNRRLCIYTKFALIYTCEKMVDFQFSSIVITKQTTEVPTIGLSLGIFVR